jgi:hypothetical protein
VAVCFRYLLKKKIRFYLNSPSRGRLFQANEPKKEQREREMKKEGNKAPKSYQAMSVEKYFSSISF